MEEKVGSLEVATAHGFGELRQELVHLRQLVESTINRPPAPTPVWVALLASGTLLTGLASMVLAIVQLVT